MPSGFKKYASVFTASVFIIYIGICAYLYSIQEKAIFLSRTIPVEQPLNFSIQHQELFLNTDDGAMLNGVYFYARQAKGVMLYFHGNAQNILDMQYAAKPFVDRGYDFLAMDYRSYGKSTGKLSEENLFDDAALFYDWLKNNDWQENEIILYGRSLGTGIATELASRTNPAGVLLYSPYYSMSSLVADIYPIFPARLLLKYPLESGKYMQTVTAPVLILHGDKDTLIPIEHAQELSEVRGKLVVFEGGGHNRLTRFPLFWESIDEFLDTFN